MGAVCSVLGLLEVLVRLSNKDALPLDPGPLLWKEMSEALPMPLALEFRYERDGRGPF
jgi:hypothetical protein